MAEIQFKKSDFSGLGLGIATVIVSKFLASPKAFPLFLGLGLIVTALPFIFRMINETRISEEKEEMFLEFSRNLVESVKTGTPISKSIINIANKDYGVLSPHIEKLANQISLGIPLNQALKILSKDINNRSISR